MSLNNIQLSPISVAQLFKDSLIELDNSKPFEQIHSSSLNILGKNKKNILILVNNEEDVYLPDEELNFLLGILSACRLTMEDVGILNFKKNKEITYKSIASKLPAEIVFLFGVTPESIQLPLGFPYYQVQQYNNQTYLSAPLLSAIKEDKNEKAKLWSSLKIIFNL
jgi:hypothetical protein